MKKQMSFLLGLTIIILCTQGVLATFIVETHDSGLGFSNFSGTPRYTTTQSAAPGLEATSSAYGSTTAFPDVYGYSYTPGTDADNWSPAQYTWLGNGVSSTGLPGGQTGYYNVFITWPESENVPALCDIEITHDGGTEVVAGINMNTGQSGTPGANNSWLPLAMSVHLTAGQTYTVTQIAHADEWVSMRSSGVLWEFVEVPEPTTLLLLGIGGLVIRRRS